QRPHRVRVVVDRHAHTTDTGGVHVGQLGVRPDVDLVGDRDLPAAVELERPVGRVLYLDAVDHLDRTDDLMRSCLVVAQDDEVPHDAFGVHIGDVDVEDLCPEVTEDRGNPPVHSWSVLHP